MLTHAEEAPSFAKEVPRTFAAQRGSLSVPEAVLFLPKLASPRPAADPAAGSGVPAAGEAPAPRCLWSAEDSPVSADAAPLEGTVSPAKPTTPGGPMWRRAPSQKATHSTAVAVTVPLGVFLSSHLSRSVRDGGLLGECLLAWCCREILAEIPLPPWWCPRGVHGDCLLLWRA